MVREQGAWRFATEEGVEEIVNRRIGANERNAISVLKTYLDAQKEYASRDRNGDGVLQYAQKLGSAPGKHDGLYWPADESKGEEASPFGPLVAESAAYLKGVVSKNTNDGGGRMTTWAQCHRYCRFY